MFLVFGIILVVVLFYKYMTANNDYFAKRGIPHHKADLLEFISLLTINRKSITEMTDFWYNERKDEQIWGIFQFRNPMYFLRDPKLVKKLAVKEFDHFAEHQIFLDPSIDKMFGKSLVSLQGQKWRDMRATLSPMFTGSKMRMMYNHVADIGKQTAKTISQQIKAGGENQFEFKTLATKFTVDVIASCAFGIEVNSFENPKNDFARMAVLVTDFTNWKTGLKFLGYIMAAPLMKALNIRVFDKEVDTFFQEAVIETMKVREERGIVRNDVINLLMQVRKGKLTHETKEEKVTEGFATVEESQMGKSQVKTMWDDEDLAAQCFIFFFAGYDTISTTMGFMAHEIAVNPDVQEKLFNEIQAMEAELDGKTISYEQIQGLKYMDQVVCETLRKWPAAPMTDRVCVKDYNLKLDNGKKITIEKGKVSMIPIYSFHHDPEYFPNPDKFDPERFSEENRHKIDPDTYLPFGVGPRNCIGSRFALMELKTIFYYLLLNFSFEVTAKTQIPLQLEKNIMGIKTEKGAWVGFKPRE